MKDYAKIDAILEGYRQATDKAGYLADVWGDLTMPEADAVFDAMATCPHSASQNMGGECERCYAKRTA